MCLRTSTFVVKPMLLISTHWLLWRCDPLDLCSDRPSETQKATFSRAGALHLSLLSHKRQALKVCVPLFLFSRRKEGDQGVAPQEGEMAPQDEDVQEGNPLR